MSIYVVTSQRTSLHLFTFLTRVTRQFEFSKEKIRFIISLGKVPAFNMPPKTRGKPRGKSGKVSDGETSPAKGKTRSKKSDAPSNKNAKSPLRTPLDKRDKTEKINDNSGDKGRPTNSKGSEESEKSLTKETVPPEPLDESNKQTPSGGQQAGGQKGAKRVLNLNDDSNEVEINAKSSKGGKYRNKSRSRSRSRGRSRSSRSRTREKSPESRGSKHDKIKRQKFDSDVEYASSGGSSDEKDMFDDSDRYKTESPRETTDESSSEENDRYAYRRGRSTKRRSHKHKRRTRSRSRSEPRSAKRKKLKREYASLEEHPLMQSIVKGMKDISDQLKKVTKGDKGKNKQRCKLTNKGLSSPSDSAVYAPAVNKLPAGKTDRFMTTEKINKYLSKLRLDTSREVSPH